MKRYLFTLLIALFSGGLAQSQIDSLSYALDFQTRKDTLFKYLANDYAFRSPGRNNTDPAVPDPEKYAWPAVIARFEEYGLSDSLANLRIETFKSNNPFHFTMIGMARIMPGYTNAPKMQQHKNLYLSKVFARTDSYNGLTGEGTENHVNMTRCAAYIYAELADPSTHPKAAQWKAQLKTYILYYGKRIYNVGTAEWNSSTYTVYNTIGWLALYDYAQDPEVRDVARAVLDYYATELALSYRNGNMSGAESRGANGYESFTADSEFLSWMWFGAPNNYVPALNSGNKCIQAVHAAVSSYRPPIQIVHLANKVSGFEGNYKMGRPTYLLDSSTFIHNQLYLGKSFTLGSAVIPYAGYTGGDYQYVSFKLSAKDASGNKANVLTGNGRYYSQKRGRGLEPFTQFAQHNNTVIMMTKAPSNWQSKNTTVQNQIAAWRINWSNDFKNRFPNDNKGNPVSDILGAVTNDPARSYVSYPNALQTASNSGVSFIDMESAYVAVRSIHEMNPGTLINFSSGRNGLEDNGKLDSLNGFVIEAFDASDFSSFLDMQTKYLANTSLDKSNIANGQISYQNFDGQMLVATYKNTAKLTKEPLYDWYYGTTTPQVIPNSPPFRGPNWPTGAGYGRVPSLTVDGQSVGYDSLWPVFKGKQMSIDNQRLDIVSQGKPYFVDYTGPLPVFSNMVLDLEDKQVLATQDIRVYPNPFSNYLTIQLPIAKSVKASYSILDTKGAFISKDQAIVTDPSGRFSFNGQPLPSGTYVIHVRVGNQRFASKIVK